MADTNEQGLGTMVHQELWGRSTEMTEQPAPVNPLCTVIPVNQNSRTLRLQRRNRRQPSKLEKLHEELKNYESIRKWFRQLKKKAAAMENGEIPRETLKAAIFGLNRYRQYLHEQYPTQGYINPDNIIADLRCYMKAEGSLMKHNDLLDEYWEQAPTKSTAHLDFSMIKSFYKANSYALTTTAPKRGTVREGKFELTSEHIRRICSIAPIEYSSWILANNYLAVRIGILASLKVKYFQTEHWTKDLPLYPVFIPLRLSGTFEYTTYIGNDAMQLCKVYFEMNDFKDEDCPWAYSTETTKNAMFKKYAYDAGVIDAPHGLWPNGVPKGLSPVTPHINRQRKQTIAERHKINSNWIDHMLGHIPKGTDAKHYSKPNQEDIYKANLEILPDLEIFGHHSNSPTRPTV